MPGLEKSIMSLELSDADYAARLIRVSPKVKADSSTTDSRFLDTVKKTIGNEPGPNGGKKPGNYDKKLMDACTEMESLFVAKMLKEMRNTVHKTGWINGGFAEEIFQDMLYDEYALSLSKNSSLGLSKMLYDELKRKL